MVRNSRKSCVREAAINPDYSRSLHGSRLHDQFLRFVILPRSIFFQTIVNV